MMFFLSVAIAYTTNEKARNGKIGKIVKWKNEKMHRGIVLQKSLH